MVDDINVHDKTITWVYVGPRKSQFAVTAEKGMAKENASKTKSWVLQTAAEHKHTAVWGDSEMIVSWDKTGSERGWCIPKQQYTDRVTVLRAMEEQHDHDTDSSPEDDEENNN